jgi:hypothetical protein
VPIKQIDYSKTVMYKIVPKDLNNNYIYVGSTTEFTKRKSLHKSDCINVSGSRYELKVYQMIRQNGGWNEFEMIEIEKYPCNDKNESSARERYWKEFFNANMNTQVPGRTKKMWFEDNPDYQKNYAENNKNELREKKHNYYETNKDIINNKQKIYNDANKETIKLKKHVQFICDCGGRYIHSCRARHFKTDIHLKWIEQNNNIEDPLEV